MPMVIASQRAKGGDVLTHINEWEAVINVLERDYREAIGNMSKIRSVSRHGTRGSPRCGDTAVRPAQRMPPCKRQGGEHRRRKSAVEGLQFGGHGFLLDSCTATGMTMVKSTLSVLWTCLSLWSRRASSCRSCHTFVVHIEKREARRQRYQQR